MDGGSSLLFSILFLILKFIQQVTQSSSNGYSLTLNHSLIDLFVGCQISAFCDEEIVKDYPFEAVISPLISI